jgi:hypothetical protein
MKKLFKIAFVVTMLISACIMDKFYTLHVDNSSGISICVYLAWSTYPDTTLSFDSKHLTSCGQGKYYLWDADIPIDKFLMNDTLSIYFLAQDTLDKYSWLEIQQAYNILRRYDLSAADIKALDETIPYPPTVAMKNMKMYPPYGK